MENLDKNLKEEIHTVTIYYGRQNADQKHQRAELIGKYHTHNFRGTL